MSDIPSLPLASRKTVEDFVHRSEFWLQVPGNERKRFWETDNPDNRPYLFPAPQLVEFTKANCLATTADDKNEILNKFKTKLQTDWEKSRTAPLEGIQFAHLLGEYVGWIDRVFFFGVLTRPRWRGGDLDKLERQIIGIQMHEGLRGSKGEVLEGQFSDAHGTLFVNLQQNSGKAQAFEKAICVVAHELVHAYLHILTRDNSGSNYLRQMYQDYGHGIQFHALLRFILDQLFQWLPIPYIGEMAKTTGKDLDVAFSKRLVSESVSRSIIYKE